MSNSSRELLLICSNIKQLSESNLLNINSIKDISEEIFDITVNKPIPNRISLISKKTSNIIRKENTLLNINKEISYNCNKIEEILLNLYRKKNDNDNNANFNELTENFKRRNNEFEKLRKINENLNNEINSLKNRLNATYPQNKFLNEELIDIYSVEKLNILSNKKEIKKKESKPKIPSENNSKIDNRALKDLKEREKQLEEETKKLKDQNLKDKNLISQLETEINKFKSELKSKESSSLDITSKLSKAENELKKLQDDYIKLLTENEEKKASIVNKDSLIKDLMKDCDDKKKLIEEEKNNNNKKDNDILILNKEIEELKQKIEKDKELYETRIKEATDLASKNVPMLTKKFKELMTEIEILKKDKKNFEQINKELLEEKNNFNTKLEEANKIAKEAQMKLKSKEALIKQIQKRLNTTNNSNGNINTPSEKKEEIKPIVNNDEIINLKNDIKNKDELMAQLYKEKENLEEKLKNYMTDNKDELIQKINRKDEVISIQKNKIEDLEKKLKNSDISDKNEGLNRDNLEDELKNKKMKLNKLEMKITVAKVNFNKLLKEIQISNENKLFIIQLMKNLGFDDKDMKMIEEKIKELK